MSEKYNGWTNYETWNVKLWLDNEEGSQNYWSEAAQEAWDNAEADSTFTREEKARLDLRERLKRELDDDAVENGYMPELAGFYADILNAALNEVNWYEIAGSYIDEVDKEGDDGE